MKTKAPVLRTTATIVLAILNTTCQDAVRPGDPAEPLYEIVDGRDSGGNEHFFFLPPLQPNPTPNGAFEASFSPTVEICALSQCGAANVVAYSTVPGRGSETIRAGDDHYIVNWHTDQYALDPSVTYRIRVMLGGAVLGYADVDVVNNGSELKRVDNSQYIGLQNGRTLPIRFRIEEGAGTPPNHAPVASAGADQAIELSEAATLNGAATDDGLPAGSTLDIAWSQVSGPGTVTFTSPNAASTSASFSTPGTYVLRLSASDTEFLTSDDVTVTVYPDNQPPVVSAGPDQAITLPNSAALNGTVSDDGFPAGSTLAIDWSGPGATFGNPHSPVTTVSFAQPGTYQVTLTASDGEFTVSDVATITVAPQNQAPIVNAGADQSVTNLAALAGSATDDGLPAGSTLAFSWSQVSGPGTATFSSPNSDATNATFDVAGTYVLRLSASDGDLTGSDDVSIAVAIDRQAPIVTIVAPTAGQVVGATHTFLFTVDDPEAVTDCSIDGSSIPCVGGSAIALDLPHGSHTVTIVATDQSGNSSVAAVSYFVDAAGPVFTSSAVNESEIEFTVADQSEIIAHYCSLDGLAAIQCGSGTHGTFALSGLPAGDHRLEVRAIDEFGNMSATPLIVLFSTQAPNQAPVVNAGADQSVTNLAALAGSATDDGLPAGSTLGFSWSQVSGPGTATFASPSSEATITTFDVGGTYVLRLSVSDGDLAGSDDVSINVAIDNTPPVVTILAPREGEIVGPTHTFQFQVDDPGAVTNCTLDGASIQCEPDAVVELGPLFDGIHTIVVEATDVWGNRYLANLSYIVDARGPVFDPGQTFVPPLPAPPTSTPETAIRFVAVDQSPPVRYVCELDGASSNSCDGTGGAGVFEWVSLHGGDHVLEVVAFDAFNNASAPLVIPFTTLTPNQSPVVNAGPDLTVFLPANATLNGAVTDDGYPAGSTLTINWSEVSGPGTVTFSSANSASTTASFSGAGTYVLRLTASDGEFSTSDDAVVVVEDLTISGTVSDASGPLPGVSVDIFDCVVNGSCTLVTTATTNTAGQYQTISLPTTFNQYKVRFRKTGYVQEIYDNVATLLLGTPVARGSTNINAVLTPENQAPVVNAGPDLTVFLPANATLNGTVTDDGLPAGATLSISWSKVSGPGAVTFSNPNSATTTAAFSEAGIYVLRLSSSDTEFTASDDVTVTVVAPNQSPVVDGGPDLAIQLPNTATLNGSVTDDGLPQGSTLTISWSTFSGPGTVTFSNANAASTTAAFSEAGSYVLRLTASDGEFTVSDDVSVTVIPPNQPPVVNAGPDLSVVLPANATLNGSVTDDGLPQGSTLTIGWSKVSGPGTATFSNANSAATTASFSEPGTYVVRLTAGDGEHTVSDDATITVFAGNQPPVVSAGPDRFVILPASALLNGTVTDDGLPLGSTLSISWTQISGPGTVSFANPGAASTMATFPVSGTYVLRLTASDGEFTVGDEMSVRPANNPPAANAGPDQAVVVGTLVTLNGTGSVDLDGDPLTYAWTITQRPAGSVAVLVDPTTEHPSFTPDRAGSYAVELIVHDGFDPSVPDFVTIVANPPGPPITVSNASLGKDLQGAFSFFLSAAAPAGGLLVTLTSDSPDLLLAPNATTVGGGSVTIPVAPGVASGVYWAQALAGSGSAQVSASAPGYTTGAGTMTLTPSGFTIFQPSGNFTTTTFSANTNVQISSQRLNAGTLAPAGQQALRAGLNGIAVPVTSSNTSVGTITVSPVTFNQNQVVVTTFFDPANGGASTIAVAQPAGFSTPSLAQSIVATVTAPIITVPDGSVGKDLQLTAVFTLGAPAPAGGLVVTLTSNNPDVLLAPDGTTPGGATTTITVPAGISSRVYFVQALSDVGTATITATAPGFADGTGTVTLMRSGFGIVTPGDFSTTSLSLNTNIQVQSFRLTPTNAIGSSQPMRAGFSASVEVTNSNTAVGTITISPLVFNQNIFVVNTAFDPASAGSTTISLVQPAGFTTPINNQSIVATVTAPGITLTPLTVGKDLQGFHLVTLGAPAPAGGVSVTVQSDNPDVVLAPNVTTVGASSITLTVSAGASTVNVVSQALAGAGTATITASAPAFTNGSTTVTLVPSGFIIFSPGNFTTTSLSANTQVQIQAFRLNPANNAPTGSQPLRAGLNNVQVPVTSSNPSAGVITISPVVFNQNVAVVNTAFDPIDLGTTTIAVAQPAGFSLPSLQQSVTATVTAPSLTINNVTVGKDLQTSALLQLGAPAPAGGLIVTLFSNNPNVLLAPDATTPGTTTLILTLPAGTSNRSYFVQALGETGNGQITAAAPAFEPGASTATLAPSGFITQTSSIVTTAGGGNVPVNIQSARLNSSSLSFAANQPLRAGLSGVQVPVTSSNTTVGTITLSPLVFNQNVGTLTTQFDPASVGFTTITVGTPVGFSTPSNSMSFIATVQ